MLRKHPAAGSTERSLQGLRSGMWKCFRLVPYGNTTSPTPASLLHPSFLPRGCTKRMKSGERCFPGHSHQPGDDVPAPDQHPSIPSRENTPQKETRSLPEPAAAAPLRSAADSKPQSPSKLLAEQTKEKQTQEHMARAQHLSKLHSRHCREIRHLCC